MKKLAIGYIRVSTQAQDDEGQSLETQATSIRNYAKDRSFELAGIYKDVASALPGKLLLRPDFKLAVKAAQAHEAVLIVTDVDRLSRSYDEVMEQIVTPGVGVHVVSLNRKIAAGRLLTLAKQAEADGLKKGHDTEIGLGEVRARGKRLGAPKKVLQRATANSLKKRVGQAWQTVIDLAIFISADPIRRDWTKREVLAGLNAANIRTTRGNIWTVGALTRPLRNAKAHLKIQDEPDDGPA